MKKGQKLSPGKASIFSAMLVVCFVFSVTAALAAVRELPYISFIQTNTTARFATNAFGRGGFAYIAGGVVLDGRAEFFFEDSNGARAVSAKDIGLQIDRDQNIYLDYRGTKFELEAHKGIACPLGRFIMRDGRVLFTVPPDVPAGRQSEQDRLLTEAGLVDGTIAKEFANTRFASLAAEIDFADTVPLPDALNKELVSGINAALRRGGASQFGDSGSYVNSDSQVTYKVYLLAASKRTDIAGVPLRYDWDSTQDGTVTVNFVEAFSTDWPKDARIAELTRNNRTSQYDYVIFYQVSGIFRQVFVSNPTAFRNFVSKACAS